MRKAIVKGAPDLCAACGTSTRRQRMAVVVFGADADLLGVSDGSEVCEHCADCAEQAAARA